MNDIKFIPKDIILFFHEQLVKIYGGSFDIRDENLLDSALEQPKATYQGEYLHDSLLKMAAAYGYHLCNNHPFIDGNKRIGLTAMNMFLIRNNLEINVPQKEIYKLMIKVSSGQLSKKDLTVWLKNNTNFIN